MEYTFWLLAVCLISCCHAQVTHSWDGSVWQLGVEAFSCYAWKVDIAVQEAATLTFSNVNQLNVTEGDCTDSCRGTSKISFEGPHRRVNQALRSLSVRCGGEATSCSPSITFTAECSLPCAQALGHRGGKPFATQECLDFVATGAAAGVEIDTQLSSDKVIVWHHDPTLGDQLDGSGKICNYTLEQLQAMDVVAPGAASTERLLTMEEMLLHAKQHNYITILDLKAGCQTCAAAPTCDWIASEFGHAEAAKAYVQLLEDTDTKDIGWLFAFDGGLVSSIQNEDPDAIVVWAPSATVNTASDLEAYALERSLTLETMYTSYEVGALQWTHSELQKARDMGAFMDGYTANSESQMTKLINAGFDTVETDEIALFNSVKNEICMPSFEGSKATAEYTATLTIGPPGNAQSGNRNYSFALHAGIMLLWVMLL